MPKKRKINHKVKLFAISLLTMAFILLVWGYILQESNNYKSSAISSFSRNQEMLVDQVAKSVKEGLKTLVSTDYSLEHAEDEVVTGIISKAEASGSKYWFLYSTSTGVVFEKNLEETRNFKGKSTSDMVRHWKLRGGTAIDEFEMLLERQQNGSSVFTKNVDYGEEIVSENTLL